MKVGSRSALGDLAAFFRLSPESDRFLHLDALRFIASAGVVAFHYQEWITWRSPPVKLEALFGFGQFVDLFFVISGVVIFDLYRGRIKRPHDYGRFLRKRVARLLPLHLLTLAFFCVIAAAAERFGRTGSSADWSCLVPTALLVHSFGICRDLSFNTPSWSISAEMAMYVCFPLMTMLLARGRLAWLVWLIVLFALAGLNARGGPPWFERSYDFGVLRAVPAFLFGGLLASRRDLLGRVPAAPALMWVALALFVALRVAEAPAGFRVACVYLIPLFGLAADQQRRAGRTVRAIAPLGQLTYSIYMLHVPVAWAVLDVAAPRLGLGGQAMNLAVISAGFVVLPVVSIASLRLFETPMRRWLSGDRPTGAVTASPQEAAGDFAP
ncbi:acyltransferase [Sphingomonas sp. PB2P19]|uniref:acyltransferase family protein n=1 Tax=Sphingomonas rhamnosi TaxID=3096156 RepID=UPI002FCA2AED